MSPYTPALEDLGLLDEDGWLDDPAPGVPAWDLTGFNNLEKEGIFYARLVDARVRSLINQGYANSRGLAIYIMELRIEVSVAIGVDIGTAIAQELGF